VSGILARTFEFPADSIKVLLQTAKPGTYKGPLDAASTIIRAQGVGGLYRGLTTPLFGSVFVNASLFAVYKRTQRALGIKENVWSSRLSYGVCGAVAGAAASFVLTPVELIKCRMQCSGRGDTRSKGMYSWVSCIYKLVVVMSVLHF
jgi:hypothetical protein